MGYGATAGTDGMHIHLGYGHRPGADAALVGEADVTVNQRHIGGGASHVKGQ